MSRQHLELTTQFSSQGMGWPGRRFIHLASELHWVGIERSNCIHLCRSVFCYYDTLISISFLIFSIHRVLTWAIWSKMEDSSSLMVWNYFLMDSTMKIIKRRIFFLLPQGLINYFTLFTKTLSFSLPFWPNILALVHIAPVHFSF